MYIKTVPYSKVKRCNKHFRFEIIYENYSIRSSFKMDNILLNL
jgi:hypothetical protein